MKKIIFISIFAGICFISKSQNQAISLGWHMLKSGAQVKVIQGNSGAVSSNYNWSQINYENNEVLNVFNVSKDKYYCYDPEGRIILVKGQSPLQKIEMQGRPVVLVEEVKIGLDKKFQKGNFVWLIGFNSSTKTASILLSDGSVIEIPQNSAQDLKEYFDLKEKSTDWKVVE
jgi:hypothetical protein